MGKIKKIVENFKKLDNEKKIGLIIIAIGLIVVVLAFYLFGVHIKPFRIWLACFWPIIIFLVGLFVAFLGLVLASGDDDPMRNYYANPGTVEEYERIEHIKELTTSIGHSVGTEPTSKEDKHG